MIKYDEFLVINEAKVDNYQVGDYVICDKNFRGVQNAEGKLCKIENIQDVADDKFFTLKVQKPEDPDGRLRDWNWMVYHRYRHVDTFTISKSQARNITKISEEEAKDFIKGTLDKYQATKFVEDILKELKFKVKKKYINVNFINIDPEKSDVVTAVLVSKFKAEVKAGRFGGIGWNAPFRQPIKISKFFRKLDPDLTDKQIDALIPKWKVAWEKIVKNTVTEVQVVTGEDIRFWYHGENYGADERGYQGNLGSSCMRYAKSQRRFDIYCENPDKCALAILLDGRGQLVARAIIWKLDDGGVYMDRIYGVDNASEQKMRDYCKKQKMLGPWERDRNGVKRVTVKRDYGQSTSNPYMDTFKRFNHETFTLLTPAAYNEDYAKKPFRYSTYTDND